MSSEDARTKIGVSEPLASEGVTSAGPRVGESNRWHGAGQPATTCGEGDCRAGSHSENRIADASFRGTLVSPISPVWDHVFAASVMLSPPPLYSRQKTDYRSPPVRPVSRTNVLLCASSRIDPAGGVGLQATSAEFRIRSGPLRHRLLPGDGEPIPMIWSRCCNGARREGYWQQRRHPIREGDEDGRTTVAGTARQACAARESGSSEKNAPMARARSVVLRIVA
jgi:hypothetical protein